MATWAENQRFGTGIDAARACWMKLCVAGFAIRKLWLREDGHVVFLVAAPEIAALSMLDAEVDTVTRGTSHYKQFETCQCIVCWEVSHA